MFQSGFLWGANIYDINEEDPHVGGSTYREGLQGGWIDGNGNVVPPSDPDARIYRVRPTVFPGGPSVDVSAEADDEGLSEADIRAQYETDWTQWPADLGAPYFDANGNGVYDPIPDPVDSLRDIPGVPGADQTIWYVANDQEVGLTQGLYGSLPMGIEMQATMWAYAQTGALGSMFFRRYVLINKSDVLGNPRTFDSMYVSMWSDVDLGNATDDFAGSDTTLSLMYVYNGIANDPTYNPLPPPAVGFDFFQGPLVDGIDGEDRNKNGINDSEDFGIFKGRNVGPGKINLPMTAAYYFTRGDATVTDPVLGSQTEGAVRFYRFMQGKIGLTGAPFVNPVTGLPTPYVLSGDPIAREGWVDGLLQGPGDRRVGEASGPFVMAPGDTQEVVVAEIVAGAIPGVDRLSAISLLKFYDQIAQVAYDNFFDLPTPPLPAPEVAVVALDKKIVLDWGENQTAVELTESSNSKGYLFEGYNVYQLPNESASISEGERIATYDLNNGIGKISDLVFDPNTGSVVRLPVQFGNDTGIKRYLEITQDAFTQVPLINGNRYYFAVTAYNYNPDPLSVPNNLENPIAILTIVPQSKNPGEIFGSEFNDTLAITKDRIDPTLPFSDGFLYPLVIDPRNPNFKAGNEYKVSFEVDTTGEDDVTVWYIERNGERILEGQTNQDADFESPIIDGIQFRVQGAPLDFKGFDITANAGGEITGAECTYSPSQVGADLKGISADWFRDVNGPGGALSGCVETPMQVAGGYYFFAAGDASGVGTVGDYETMRNRLTNNLALFSVIIPNNYEIRWTGSGKGLWPEEFGFEHILAGTYDIPFELWFLGPNLDNPADDIRMIPIILDMADTVGASGTPTFGFQLDAQASSGNNDPYSDWIYFHMPTDQTPGDAGYQAFFATNPTSWGATQPHIRRLTLFNWNLNQGSGSTEEQPEVGTVFRIRATIPNSPNDYYTFTVPDYQYSNDLAKDQVDQINVYPNPYYGVNTEELNKYNRFCNIYSSACECQG